MKHAKLGNFPVLCCAVLFAFGIASNAQLQPSLSIQRLSLANRDVQISWPAPSPGFSLEQTEFLSPLPPFWEGVSTSPILQSNRFVLTLPAEGTNRFFRLRKLLFEEPPADPAENAPPLAQTEVTSLADATAFLYTGSNAVQVGVAPGTIEPTRVAVLRGKVMRKDGSPLPAVNVSVLNHPEFGLTATRTNGMFDLAVNGGGELFLVFEKIGFCQVQRDLLVPWQDYLCLPDIVMVPADTNATSITLGTNSPQQLHQASILTDQDGTRCAAILFPTGTCANLRLPDGTLLPCPGLTVRATEFTVGTNGPAAMPAVLPPTSRYTYCVDVNADEAVAAGANSVEFDRDLFFYVENFLGYEVGAAVPSGFYDRDRGFWVPQTNGRIIKIVGSTGGLVEIDSDGDDLADDAALLAARGFTDAERQRISLLYTNGQELWRMPIRHFSYFDFNFNAIPPDIAGPKAAKKQANKPEGKPGVNCGSIIEVENQVLGEVIPLVGTPFALHYRSGRTPGYLPGRRLRIPVSGTNLASDIIRLETEVEVAGRVFTQSFPPQTGLIHEFTWDGLDAYGRSVQGQAPATMRIRHIVPEASLLIDRPREELNSFGIIQGVPLQRGHSRTEGVFQQEIAQMIGAWDARGHGGLGGWTFSEHHAYDPVGKTLYLGDGTQRSAENLNDIIQTFAGNGGFCDTLTSSDDCFSGMPAKDARLGLTEKIEIAADGTVFLLHVAGAPWSISRITPDGIIREYVGGRPARLVQLDNTVDIALSPDGLIHFVDNSRTRVLRVSADERVLTVAGNGTLGFSGDGGPATAAQFNLIGAIAFGPDGSLYIVDAGNVRIRRVGSDGIVSAFAGTGPVPNTQLPDVDVPAVQARLNGLGDIAVSPDGTVVFLAAARSGFGASPRIYRIGTDGIIRLLAGGSFFAPGLAPGRTALEPNLFNLGIRSLAFSRDGTLYFQVGSSVAGNGVWCLNGEGVFSLCAGQLVTRAGGLGFGGDEGPATQALLNQPGGVGVAPDGTLYIADGRNFRVRRIAKPLPAFSGTDIAIASDDGSLLYRFNSSGRHLSTIDALTGAALLTFDYDAAGRLSAVRDAFDNTTAIERDGNGTATAIVGPYGARTRLNVDTNGWLASVVNPANETNEIICTASGLLTQFARPNGQRSQYTFDTQGRLMRNEDAAGGARDFYVSEQPPMNGQPGRREVITVSALSRTNRHVVEIASDGARRRTVIRADGVLAESFAAANGVTTNRPPEGAVSIVTQTPDPRFGMMSPLPGRTEFRTPGGLRATNELRASVQLATANDPLSLVALTNEVVLNGRTSRVIYAAAARTLTATSAGGRVVRRVLDLFGRVVETQYANLATNRFDYDERGRLTNILSAAGSEARSFRFFYETNGYLAATIDALNRTNRLERDSGGRLIRQVRPDGEQVTAEHDANGNINSLTPPGRPAHLLTYNGIDQMATLTAPDAGPESDTTAYTYDLDHALARVTFPDGRGITNDYSAGGNCNCGRLNAVSLERGTADLTYNPANGLLTSMTGLDGIDVQFNYDGPLLTNIVFTGVVTGRVSVVLNNDLLPVKSRVNGAHEISIDYDADRLLTRAGGLEMHRDAATGFLSDTVIGSVTDHYAYNGFGDITGYSAAFDGTNLFTETVMLDAVGRITNKTEIGAGETNVLAYAYDLAGRLHEVRQNGVLAARYTYDANGNPVAVERMTTNGMTALSATYDAQDRVLTYGGATFTHRASGEILTRTESGQTNTYHYDELGNLLQAVTPLADVQYRIDPQGRRVEKRVNGNRVRAWLWSDALRPIAELESSNAVTARFVYADGVNVPDYFTKGTNTFRMITDHLGSVRLVVNAQSGEIIQRLDYDEWGRVTLDTNPGFQPFGFAGGLYDPDTGLVRFGARDYDAQTGRWTHKDPIGFAGRDPNLYAYAGNDPVNQFDPRGTQRMAEQWAAGYGQIEQAVSGVNPGSVVALTPALATAPALSPQVLNSAKAALGVAGNVAGGITSVTSGARIGSGLDQISQGNIVHGVTDYYAGLTTLGLNVASYTSWGLKSPAALVTVAFIATSTAVNLAVEDIKAATEGRETNLDVADEFWTKFFYDQIFNPCP